MSRGSRKSYLTGPFEQNLPQPEICQIIELNGAKKLVGIGRAGQVFVKDDARVLVGLVELWMD